MPDSNTSMSSWRARYAVLVIVCAGAALMALQPVRSPDVWHHLGCGRLVAETGGPARADVFSHTAAGRRWIQYEWLAQLILYGAHAALGVTGLIVLQAASVAAAGAMLYRLGRRTAPPAAAAAAVLLTLCGMSARIFTRPELFTWLFFAGLMLAVERVRSGARLSWLIPALLVAAWVNFHGAWIAGLAWMGLLCAGETLSALRRGANALPKAVLLRLWAALALAFLATLVNPWGAHIWEVPFGLSGSREVTSRIAEWQRPTLDFFLHPRHIGVAALLAGIALAPRVLSIADALVLLFFGGLSLTAVRHLPLALLVAAPILARLLAAVARKAVTDRWRERLSRRGVVSGGLAALALLLAFIALGGWGLPRCGVALAQDAFPIRAAEALERYGLDGNLFNSYAFGNYLLFRRHPQNPVFIDGRVDMYGSDVVRLYDEVRKATPGWDQRLRDLDVSVCVIETAREPDRPLLMALHASPDWAAVFWDRISAVYVRRERLNTVSGARPYIYVVRPDAPDYARIEGEDSRATAERDYRHALDEDPRNVVALQGLAEIERRKGRRDETLDLLCRAVALQPEHAGLRYNLASALLESGRLPPAEMHLRKALALGGHEAAACKALGVIAMKQKAPARAAHWFERAVRTDPNDWKGWWNLSAAREAEGDLAAAAAAMQRVLALQPENSDARARLNALTTRQGSGV